MDMGGKGIEEEALISRNKMEIKIPGRIKVPAKNSCTYPCRNSGRERRTDRRKNPLAKGNNARVIPGRPLV